MDAAIGLVALGATVDGTGNAGSILKGVSGVALGTGAICARGAVYQRAGKDTLSSDCIEGAIHAGTAEVSRGTVETARHVTLQTGIIATGGHKGKSWGTARAYIGRGAGVTVQIAASNTREGSV